MDPLVKSGWLLYQLLINAGGPPLAALASLKGRFGGRWRERLGLIKPFEKSVPRVIFHAASVGEARSAAVVIRAFLARQAEAEVIFSVSTPAGLETAGEIFHHEKRVRVLAAPLDFWGAAGRFVRAVRPRALIIWETELWPNFIAGAKNSGAPVILAAARLSDRSFKRYRRVGSFMADLLSRFELIAPAGLHEERLFLRLGAPPEKMRVLGNPKFDGLIGEAESENFSDRQAQWRGRLWGSDPPGRLLVAGSTHRGEEELLLKAFSGLKKKFPGLKLILAPRHLSRAPEVLELAKACSARPASCSPGRPLFEKSEVIVLDSLGQLLALYGLAEIALVGGSFRPGLSGHNPLEPASLARPIVFGPHMSSFSLEAGGLLGCGGAIQSSPEDLEQRLNYWLEKPEAAREAGRAAYNYLAGRPPAAPALAGAIADLLRADT